MEPALKELSSASASLGRFVDDARKVLKTHKKGANIALKAPGELAGLAKNHKLFSQVDASELAARLLADIRTLEREASQAAQREIVAMLSHVDAALREQGVALTGHYPELQCGVLTLEFGKGASGMTCSLFFGPGVARLASLPGGDAEAIVAAINEQNRRLDEELRPDADFLALAYQAWETANFRRRCSGDARAPILAVLADLCFLRQSSRFLRNPGRSSFAPFGQVELAYQLFWLSNRSLDQEELVLGVATREDVKNRQSLWVPRNLKGDGVHYSTMGFRRGE